MAIKQTQAAKESMKTSPKPLDSTVFIILLIAYGLIAVLTPRMNSFDSNGPKFFTLSLLNLGTFIYLFTRKNLKSETGWQFKFFNTRVGIVYFGLLVVSLLSCFKAINVVESILHFSKILTVFSAAFLISILFTLDKRMLLYLAIAMVGWLIVDCITVYSNIFKLITGNIESIAEVKSIYANKNVFASSIFVKIPFALWLMVFKRKELQILGIAGTFMAILATFFLSTRSFYLGVFMLTILLIIFFIIQYRRSNDKYNLKLMGIYLLILLSSYTIFTVTQNNLYLKTVDRYNKDLTSRLSTINTKEASAATRLEAWSRSWMIFKANPILGIGLGNWKIVTLKEANRTVPDFTINNKAHNDFIEIATETGIFGGLLFMAIFIFAGLYFIKHFIKSPNQELIALLFIPFLGLFCYSVDAFFNFPQDRAEIQALFALFVGIVVAIQWQNETIDDSKAKPSNVKASILKYSSNIILYKRQIGIAFSIVLVIVSSILFLNFKSLRLQQDVYDEFFTGRLEHSATEVVNGFPSIPNIGAMDQPIAVQKARYLLSEQRYNEAILVLKADNSSPFDARKEYFIASAYNSMGEIDSCLAYSMKCYRIKPYFFYNIVLLTGAMQRMGQQIAGEAIIDNYLERFKNDKTAWLFASSYFNNGGNSTKARSLLDEALKYFPSDVQIMNQIEGMKMGGK